MKILKIKETMVVALALMMVILAPALAKEVPNIGDLPPQVRNRVVEFQINGEKVNANSDMGRWPISEDGRTYLPIRLFKGTMGYGMKYSKGKDYDTHTLILTKSKGDLGSYNEIIYGHELDGVDLDVDPVYAVDKADDAYTKNFEKGELPTLYGNRLYMSARKVLETMGGEVQWRSLPDRDIANVIKR